ncbi:MFS transporter [Streptomyces sp. NPDC051211]|uniref:MFS transporter n=1 Tax=Streptomyces sp. NPDC051211 TaxID=3154643 RepID=UPI00344D551F
MAAPDLVKSGTGAGAGYKAGAVLAFVCLAQFMVFLDVSIVNLALPSIQDGLGMSDVSLEYVVTAYATVLGGFLLLGGRLADRYGRRRLLQTGLTIFALASLMAGLADSGNWLIASRAVQGFGSALIAPAALSILTNTFPEGPERNKALGLWGSLSGIASIVGVILGGVLADSVGWEYIFWINVPIGLTAALLAPKIVPDSKAEGPRTRFDFFGAATLTGALLLLIFTLGEATHVGWGSERTLGSLAGVVALIAAFLVIETKVEAPVMPLRVFKLKSVSTANIAAVAVFGAFAALFFFASIFMQQVYGYSPLKAGFAYVPLAVSVAVGAGVASGLIAKVAARIVLIIGLATTIAGLLLLYRAPSGGSYAVDLLPGFILLGLGCGMCFVTLQIAAFAGIGDEEAGVAAGLINTSQEAGGALGLAVIVTIAYNGLADKLTAAGGDVAKVVEVQENANHNAFLAAACFAGLALLIAAFAFPKAKPVQAAPPAAGGTGTPVPAAESVTTG